MLIGILIMSVLVIAVVVLLVASPKPPDIDDGPMMSDTQPSKMPDEEQTTSVDGTNRVSPTPTPSPTPDAITESPTQKVQKVTITYNNKENKDFTAKVAEKVALRVRIEPVDAGEEIIWESSNTKVFDVVATNTEKTQATVTGIGKGVATLTVKVGGVEAECIVRVK